MIESAASVDEFAVGPRVRARLRPARARRVTVDSGAVIRPPRPEEFVVAPPALSRQQPRWMIVAVVAVVTLSALAFVLRASG